MAVELTKDIAELDSLRKSALRGNVQTVLDETIKQWQLKLDALEASRPKTEDKSDGPESSKVIRAPASALRPLKKPTTYAFDESDKFVKLYYTVPAISAATPEKITANFTETAFIIRCVDVAGVDYEIAVKGLANAIDADKSTVKIKPDNNLLIMLKKRVEGQTWKSLLKLNKAKEIKTPSFEPSGDPSDSMMGLMKKMYDDGDDDMKRTIRKAWHESQSKAGSGLPSFGDDL